jgi:hypothetical protein
VNCKSAEAIESKRVEVFALCKEQAERATVRGSGQERASDGSGWRAWIAEVTTKDKIYGE